ncbi:MAG: pirin family protein [Planctomycetota bacterium]
MRRMGGGMMTIRRSEDRGHFNQGALDTYHTFSFGDYYDPTYTRFGPLRALNEDRLQGGAGFPNHPHREMEIITYVLEGEIEQRDILGSSTILRAGDVQRMSAGQGINHSEINRSSSEPAHYLQFWLLPNVRGRRPSCEQKSFSPELKRGRLCPIVSPDGEDGSLKVSQDAILKATLLEPGEALDIPTTPERQLWVQVAGGTVKLGGQTMRPGDGAAVRGEISIPLAAESISEVLVLDLP